MKLNNMFVDFIILLENSNANVSFPEKFWLCRKKLREIIAIIGAMYERLRSRK